MPRKATLQDIERLRSLRVRGEIDLSLTRQIDDLTKSAKAQQRARQKAENVLAGESSGGAITAKTSVPSMPEHLQRICSTSKIFRGVLTILVPHAAALHAVSSWLRAGGEAEICRAASVKRVKAQIG
jgi:alpha-beta hydrolase superfamily lysophospholipase